MKLIIDGITFNRFKSLSFAPEADLIGQSLPINELQADIITDSAIALGGQAILRDDLDNIWADYRVSYAERLDPGVVRVRARSLLTWLDQDILPAAIYDHTPVEDVLRVVFSNLGATVGVYLYTLDSAFAGATVTGYCPEQTARERLLWVTFTLGAYVRQAFSETIDILPVSAQAVLIPIENTFWRPSVTYADYVTEVRVKYYKYTLTEDPGRDESVTVDGNTYVVETAEMSLANPDAPEAAPRNIVTFDAVKIVNAENVSDILSFLGRWYFKRTAVDLDIINNAAYIPGQKVTAYIDEDAMMTGFIGSASFRFGVQARASMKLTGVVDVSSGGLTIVYMCDGVQIGKASYRFPVGFVYSIPNPYIDISYNGHRYIHRPVNATVDGTMPAGSQTVTEPEAVALDLDLTTRELEIISVDAVTEESAQEEGETISIGVIA